MTLIMSTKKSLLLLTFSDFQPIRTKFREIENPSKYQFSIKLAIFLKPSSLSPQVSDQNSFDFLMFKFQFQFSWRGIFF